MGSRLHAFSKRSGLSLLAAAVVVATFAATAMAGNSESNVTSYTGCLSTSGGTLSLIRAGDAPAKPCPSGSVMAHFSGGDITKITAGSGLRISNGDGTNGHVALALDSAYTLPQGCTEGNVAKWSGTGWICAADNDHVYSNGIGLDLIDNEFRIAQSYRVQNNKVCPSGQFFRLIDAAGTFECGSPASQSTSAVRIVYQPTYTFTGPSFEKVVTTNLPEGTYTLFGRADLTTCCANEDLRWEIACELRNGSTPVGGGQEYEDLIGTGGFARDPSGERTLTVMGAISVPTGGREVGLWCKNAGGTTGALGTYGADVMAVRVGASF